MTNQMHIMLNEGGKHTKGRGGMIKLNASMIYKEK